MKHDLASMIIAYEKTGNVWRAGEILGIAGQTVHTYLKRAGVKMGNPVTATERAAIRNYYETTETKDFNLTAFCVSLGRPKTSVCKIARQMGLTDASRSVRTDIWRQAVANGSQKGKWQRFPHPRGALGMKHTPENKARFSAYSKQMWEHYKTTGTGLMSPENLQALSDRMSIQMNAANPENIYSRGKAGYREDLGPIWFRSSWEANYARYLNWLLARSEIEAWEYEPETFWFEKVKRGVRSYKPDFRVHEKGRTYFDEIKGYMDAKSKTKIKRMRIYYPETELRVIGAKEYRAIAKVMSRMLPNWESAR